MNKITEKKIFVPALAILLFGCAQVFATDIENIRGASDWFNFPSFQNIQAQASAQNLRKPVPNLLSWNIAPQSPHVHINVISPKGRYQEPLRFFPILKDDVLPVIRGMYLIDSKNQVLADDQKRLLSASRGFYPVALIVDAFDVISPSIIETTPASIRVFALLDGGKRQTLLGGKDFYQLPGHDFFSGVSEVYQVKPLLFPDGRILKNQVEISPDLKRARRFLFRFPLSKTKIPSGVSGLKTVVRDFAGNQAVKTWIFPKPLPVSSAQFHKAAKLAHSLYPAFD